jgi:hypothetical protein
METLENKQLKQRIEAAERIKRTWPALCFTNERRYCQYCDFRVFIEASLDDPRWRCQQELAPITSQQLPCPYFRTTDIVVGVHIP